MSTLFWILSAALLLSGTVAGAGGPMLPCEPSPADELDARTDSMADLGVTAKVTVDLKLVASVDVPLARIHGSLDDGAGFDRAFGVPDKLVSLRRGEVQKLRYELELEKGKLHHLFFSVRSEDPFGSPFERRTYLRVNLDPSLEPEDLGDLLQFRVGAEGEVRP